MVKRAAVETAPRGPGRVLPSPGLDIAPVLDRMCSQFVLTLTVKHAGRFNLRRDFNGLLGPRGLRGLQGPNAQLQLLDALEALLQGDTGVRVVGAGRENPQKLRDPTPISGVSVSKPLP